MSWEDHSLRRTIGMGAEHGFWLLAAAAAAAGSPARLTAAAGWLAIAAFGRPDETFAE